ncbi:Rab escort protein 1 [Heracleum sosnowskyi]|uniref:Rab escort protein 1 n=1 Tax=Heracleum sosnowskyi TaxID=360622 RepID=A0AAD8MRI3_9APIA|nr:Rab escort protein 1 [Heracleum sosnowskyi]
MADDSDTTSFPPIEPTSFDLIIIGTGLHESIIAAAASAAGKSVLHLDPNAFYGSHFASLSLPDLSTFLTSQPPPSLPISPQNLVSLPLQTRTLYSDVSISKSDEIEDERRYCVDLAGPRVLFCADLAVDLLLKSSANQYMEFKNVDECLIWEGTSKEFRNVPDSRSAIFKDKRLDWREKNQLTKFFKLVQRHLGDEEGERISKEDLESPFAEFLDKMALPPKIKSIILYAIAMADCDQGLTEIKTEVLKTKEGIKRLALYNSSVGRFPNALGALIYPIYGQGELPQAFCRRAAVKGCIYVLRMPVIAVLIDDESKSYKGVKLSSGQDLFSQKLVLDPSFIVPSGMKNSSSDILQESSVIFGSKNINQKVARGICIAKTPLKPNVSSCLVFFPPRSLYPEQVSTVRVLQLASNIAVCPSGTFVYHISALCEDAIEGKKLLSEAVNVLFPDPSISPTNISKEEHDNLEELQPTLLWHALYIQELSMGSVGSVSSMPMPDMNLNYNDAIEVTTKIYQMIDRTPVVRIVML